MTTITINNTPATTDPVIIEAVLLLSCSGVVSELAIEFVVLVVVEVLVFAARVIVVVVVLVEVKVAVFEATEGVVDDVEVTLPRQSATSVTISPELILDIVSDTVHVPESFAATKGFIIMPYLSSVELQKNVILDKGKASSAIPNFVQEEMITTKLFIEVILLNFHVINVGFDAAVF